MQPVVTVRTRQSVAAVLKDVIIDVTIKEKLTMIIERLQDQNQNISDLHARVINLEETTTICTGTTHWGDRDKPGHQPKLYVLHSPGKPCPMHGDPKPGKRLRIYVGVDPKKQDQVLEAMERQKQRAHLESQIRQAQVRLRRVERAIDDVWRIVTEQQRWEE